MGIGLDDVKTVVAIMLVAAIMLGIGMMILGKFQENLNCDHNYAADSNKCYQCTAGNTWDSAQYRCENSTGAHLSTFQNEVLSKSFNVTASGEEAVEDIGDWQTTWAVIVAASVVLGLVGAFLYLGKR